MIRSRILTGCVLSIAIAAGAASLESRAPRPFRIEVTVPATLEPKPLDGRVILVLSRRATPEPRTWPG